MLHALMHSAGPIGESRLYAVQNRSYPAMGWNSWNCFASSVTAEKIKAAADAMVESGLINHGWTYINIDDFWQVHRDSNDPTLQGPKRDDEGGFAESSLPRHEELAYMHDKGPQDRHLLGSRSLDMRRLRRRL